MRASISVTSAALTLALAALAAPALAQNATLTSLTASQVFPAWQSTVKYDVPTTGPKAGKPRGFGNFAKVTASIRYDAPTQSYIVRDTGKATATSAFGPANRVAAESNASFTVYRKTSGSTTEMLRLLNPGMANPTIALTYTSFGQWKRTTPGGAWDGATAINDTYFVYGIKTASANVPRTGTGNYTTYLDGTFSNNTATYAVTGNGTFTANFGAGTISYAATATGTPASGPVLAFGALGGTGTISFGGSSFTGNPSAVNPTYKLSLSGYFYGPNAQEIGATFRLNGGGGNGNGALVGKQ